jgi:hypothetical protein
VCGRSRSNDVRSSTSRGTSVPLHR